MPKLLKYNLVQLHMPRTGGKSLAKGLGVKELKGTMHDGPGEIPAKWDNYRTITTLRSRKDWEKSMQNYLNELSKEKENFVSHLFFAVKVNGISNLRLSNIDATFGLWPITEDFKMHCSKRCWLSWYDLYLAYFVQPADIIIPLEDLDRFIKNPTKFI